MKRLQVLNEKEWVRAINKENGRKLPKFIQ